MMKSLRNALFNISILHLAFLFLSFPAHSKNPEFVRVKILERYKPETIQIKHVSNSGVIVNINKNSVFPVYINPSDNYQIIIPGTEVKRVYAGSIKMDMPEKHIRIINTVPFEEYVKSVVLSEMGFKLSEAMQAQSILTRTWAATHLRPKKDYDFNDLTNSQVYKGIFSTVTIENSFLLPVFGKVLTYKGKLISVFYHAECAERSFSPYEIWGSNTYEYYRSENYPEVMQDNIKQWKAILPVEKINNIFYTPENRSIPTKYKKMVKNGRQGITVNNLWYGIDTFRIKINRTMGWNKLRSNNFSLKQEGENLIFEGNGFGHLVGMCQKNAVDLAKLGWSHKKILSIFYPGTKISNGY